MYHEIKLIFLYISDARTFDYDVQIKRKKKKYLHTTLEIIPIIPTFLRQIVEEIKQCQENWLQHVYRMDTNRLPKRALQYKTTGRRNTGRPRERWRDQLHLEDQGIGNTPKPS